SCTPSISRSLRYCLARALRGLVRISISALSSSSSRVAITGRRPMNSGIMPNFKRSSGCTSRRSCETLRSFLLCASEPKACERPLDVVVGGLQQVHDDVFDVLADVARLGEAGGVADGEGDVQDARERLRQERLARAGGPQQQDVRLLQLDVVERDLALDALVV